MGADKAVSDLQNARRGAHQGAQRQPTRRHACSTVTSAVQSVCVFLLEQTGTSRCAPATTTGRRREEAPNALRIGSKPTRLNSCIVLYHITHYALYYQFPYFYLVSSLILKMTRSLLDCVAYFHLSSLILKTTGSLLDCNCYFL